MAEHEEKATAPAAETEEKLTAKLRRRRAGHEVQDEVPWTAVARGNAERLAKALERATIAARIAEDNRAKDILLLDLRQATPLVDYFVIATADSRRQVNAIAGEIDQEMKKLGERKLGMEGSEEGRWTLIDYGDFVVHIFSSDARTYYALEDIWGDAVKLDWRDPAKAKVSPPATQAPPTSPAEGSAPDGEAPEPESASS